MLVQWDKVCIKCKPFFITIQIQTRYSYLSYGNTANLTYDKNLGLRMNFKSNVKCKDNMNYTSTINFKCSTGVSIMKQDFRQCWEYKIKSIFQNSQNRFCHVTFSNYILLGRKTGSIEPGLPVHIWMENDSCLQSRPLWSCSYENWIQVSDFECFF